MKIITSQGREECDKQVKYVGDDKDEVNEFGNVRGEEWSVFFEFCIEITPHFIISESINFFFSNRLNFGWGDCLIGSLCDRRIGRFALQPVRRNDTFPL